MERVAVGSICLLLTMGVPQCVLADETLAKRFLEEAPRKWEEYKPLLRGSEAQEDSLEEQLSKKTEFRESWRFICGTDGARAILDGWQKEGEQKEKAVVYGGNPDYEFELGKSPGSNNFSIEDVAPRRDPDKVNLALRLATRQGEGICRAYILDFSRFISSTDFRVTNATEVVRDGNRLVQIEFAYDLKNPGPKEKLLVGRYTGTVCFAPNSYWAIVEAKLKMLDDPRKEVGAIIIQNEIADALRGAPVIVGSHILWYDLNGNLFQRRTTKRVWKEFTGGNERFTLSAYGFPEPGTSRPSKTRLWWLGASLALAFICIALFIYRRRRNAKNTANGSIIPGK